MEWRDVATLVVSLDGQLGDPGACLETSAGEVDEHLPSVGERPMTQVMH